MIACKQKPRWAFKSAFQTLLVLASAFIGLAHAEVDLNVSDEGVVTVAGKSRGDFFFGSGIISNGVLEINLNAWSTGTRSAGNGTGGAQTNSAGNGTGSPGINSAGNGTGRRDLTMAWGTAEIVFSCNQASLIVYRDIDGSGMREEEFGVFSTDYCEAP